MAEHEGVYREPVTVTDRRRIDPETGTVREAEAPQQAPEAPAEEPAADEASAEKVAELTADLQRVQADFANFRKRVDRDRAGVVESAKSSVYSLLLPVVDDLARARGHGDLETSPLKAVADRLQTVFVEQGIAAFGEVGELFDPQLHEAVQHTGDGGVSVIGAVYRQGYRHGDRVLRTAMVAVEDEPAGAGGRATPVGAVAAEAPPTDSSEALGQ